MAILPYSRFEAQSPTRLTRRRLVDLGTARADTGAELSWVPAPVLESLGVEREKRLGAML
jgi:hypothetical protein